MLVWICDICSPIVYDKLKVSNREVLGESYGRDRVYQQRLQAISSIPKTEAGRDMVHLFFMTPSIATKFQYINSL
jgi:hypothetical protein